MIRKGTVNVKSITDLSAIYIVYRGSSAKETPGTYGLSHLLEHLICESYKHMEETFERLGINANAFTSDNTIVFRIHGLNSCIEQVKDEYIKCITNPDIDAIIADKFETERKIVLQEYGNTFTTPIHAHHYNLHRKLHGDFGPIGLRSDLEALTPEIVKGHWERQFSKPTSIIYVDKENELPADVVEYMGGEVVDTRLSQDIHDVEFELNSVAENQSSVLMMSPLIKDNFPIVKILCYMLGGGMISPLYKKVREEKGLVYFIWCFPHIIDDNTMVVEIGSEMDDENVQPFIEAVRDVLANKEEHLTQEVLDMAKEHWSVMVHKNAIMRHSAVDKFIDSMEYNLEEVMDSISLQQVHEVFDMYFAPGRWYESIDKEEFSRETSEA